MGRPKKKLVVGTETAPEIVAATFSIFPKQREFLESKESELLFVGGAGAGKSLTLGLKIAQEASKEGNVVLLCRRFGNTLRRTTLTNLLDGHAPTPPILMRGSYDFNATTNTIKIHGGGTIYCAGLDDVQKVRSMTVGMVAIDELSEVEDLEIWNELRLRIRLHTGCQQIVAAQNPGSTSSWQYKHFFLDKNPSRKVITCSALENKTLPTNTINALLSLDGATKQRMVDGLFVDSERMVYGDSLVTKAQTEILPPRSEIQKWYIGLDYGFTNPSAFILSGLDRDNNLWVYDSYEKSQMLQHDIINWVKEKNDLNPTVCVDPSAAGLIADLQANIGPSVIKADNDISIGVDRVRSLMDTGKLKISSKCFDLLKSLRGYMYGLDGKPIKKGEHCNDGLRYLVSTCWEEINTKEPDSKFYFF